MLLQTLGRRVKWSKNLMYTLEGTVLLQIYETSSEC